MAGNKNSGRQPEKYLTKKQADELLKHAPLTTDAGRTTVMKRATILMLTGKLQTRLYRELGDGLEKMSRFGRQQTLDQRAEKVRKAAEIIKGARQGGRHLRDVGEPPDSISDEPAPDTSEPQS